jgi:hypothetical protein
MTGLQVKKYHGQTLQPPSSASTTCAIYLTQTIVVATITREGAAKSWSMMRSPEIQLDVLRAGTDIRGLLDADDLLHRSVIRGHDRL